MIDQVMSRAEQLRREEADDGNESEDGGELNLYGEAAEPSLHCLIDKVVRLDEDNGNQTAEKSDYNGNENKLKRQTAQHVYMEEVHRAEPEGSEQTSHNLADQYGYGNYGEEKGGYRLVELLHREEDSGDRRSRSKSESR